MDIQRACGIALNWDPNSQEGHPWVGQMNFIVSRVFRHLTYHVGKADDGHYGIDGLRWRKLEGCTHIHGADFVKFPQQLRKEAHKLLYLPLRKRTKAWLKIHFEYQQGNAVGGISLWRMYEESFIRTYETHEVYYERDFLDCVIEAFPNTMPVEVSDNFYVVKNLGRREEKVSAEAMLKKVQKQDFRREKRKGLIQPALPPQKTSVFAQHLRNDPRLSLRHSHRTGAPNPSPFIERLQRRSQQPARAVLGDEEPGFPGVSLKAEQTRLKSKWSLLKDKHAECLVPGATRQTFDEWYKVAGDVLDCLPIMLPPGAPPPRDGPGAPPRGLSGPAAGKGQFKKPPRPSPGGCNY